MPAGGEEGGELAEVDRVLGDERGLQLGPAQGLHPVAGRHEGERPPRRLRRERVDRRRPPHEHADRAAVHLAVDLDAVGGGLVEQPGHLAPQVGAASVCWKLNVTGRPERCASSPHPAERRGHVGVVERGLEHAVAGRSERVAERHDLGLVGVGAGHQLPVGRAVQGRARRRHAEARPRAARRGRAAPSRRGRRRSPARWPRRGRPSRRPAARRAAPGCPRPSPSGAGRARRGTPRSPPTPTGCPRSGPRRGCPPRPPSAGSASRGGRARPGRSRRRSCPSPRW